MSASAKVCLRCGGTREGTKYCKPCAAAITRDRGEHPERRKPCPACGKPKEPGRRRYCVACWEARQPAVKLAERDRSRYKSRTQRVERGIAPRQPKVNEAGLVRCGLCREYLPANQFRQNAAGKYSAQCRSCYSTYLHERRVEVMFGLTLEEYERLLLQQDGRCAICMRRPRTRRLAVDHNHATGEIRGLLCTRCNHKILGAAGESPSLLRRAAAYLDSPPARTGQPIDTLGDADEQGIAGFHETAGQLADGEVAEHDGQFAVSARTFRALWQTAGWSLVVDGVRLRPDPQLAIDDAALVREVWTNAQPLLIEAGYLERREAADV